MKPSDKSKRALKLSKPRLFTLEDFDNKKLPGHCYICSQSLHMSSEDLAEEARIKDSGYVALCVDCEISYIEHLKKEMGDDFDETLKERLELMKVKKRGH